MQSKLNYPIRRSSREHSAKIRVKWIGNWFSKLGMVRKIKEIRGESQPYLLYLLAVVTQVALSVRRDPGDVLFLAGDDRADPAPG